MECKEGEDHEHINCNASRHYLQRSKITRIQFYKALEMVKYHARVHPISPSSHHRWFQPSPVILGLWQLGFPTSRFFPMKRDPLSPLQSESCFVTPMLVWETQWHKPYHLGMVQNTHKNGDFAGFYHHIYLDWKGVNVDNYSSNMELQMGNYTRKNPFRIANHWVSWAYPRDKPAHPQYSSCVWKPRRGAKSIQPYKFRPR